MIRKKITCNWIRSFAILFGPIVCVFYCELFVPGVMAQQREAATRSSRNQEFAGSKALDVKIEEPEPGVKLFGDPASITLSSPGFGWTVSNDGSILVVREPSGSLQFWSLTENRVIRTLEKPEGNSAWFPSQYSASGDVLAATYQTWETPDEDEENTEAGAIDPFQAKTTVLFVNKDGQVRSEVEIDDAFRTQRPRDIAFSPNEKSFLLGGSRKTTVVEVDSGEIIAQRSNFSAPVFVGNQTLVSVTSNEIWNFETDEIFEPPTPLFPKNSSLGVTSSDCRWALIHVQGQGGMLVRLPDGKRIPLSEIQGYMMGSFSSDGRYLAASGNAPGNDEPCWLVYDTQEELILGQVKAEPRLIAMCGNRPRVIVWNGAFRTIDLEENPNLEEQWQRIKSSPIQANSLQFGNRDQTIVNGSGHFALDLTTGRFRSYDRFSTTLQILEDEPSYIFVNHMERGPLGFYHGQQYAVARMDLVEDKLSNLYKIHPRPALIQGARALLGVGKPVQPIGIHSCGFFLSADSSILYDVRAESSTGVFLKSFDLKKNKPLAEVRLEIPKNLVPYQTSIGTMSGDRKKTAVAIGREVWVVNSQTGDLEQNWQLEKKALQLRMDQTGTRLAVIYPSQSVVESNIGKEFVVYDVAEKRILHSEQTDTILALEFRPQRSQLMVATGGTENRWRVLVANSGTQLSERSTHYARALSAAFSKDGNQLAWGLQDTRIELWDLRRVK